VIHQTYVAGQVELIMATEYWMRIGGPAPYADSYTYAIYARSDVGSTLTSFLAASDRASGWRLTGIQRGAATPVSLIARLLALWSSLSWPSPRKKKGRRECDAPYLFGGRSD